MNKSNFLIFCCSVFFSSIASGQELSGQESNTSDSGLNMLPASLIGSSRPLQDRIIFPKDVGSDSFFMRCETFITAYGVYKRSFCYKHNADDRPYDRAIIRAAARATAIPATVNNENRAVWLPFSVLFRIENGEKKVYVFPNHLIYEEQYGNDYSAPQRYLTRGNQLSCYQRQQDPVRIIQTVGANGVVKNITFGKTNQNVRCKDHLDRIYSNFNYIPAQANGKFVEGTVDEYFFSVENTLFP